MPKVKLFFTTSIGMRGIMDTQGSHAGSLQRIGVDKTSSDISVVGLVGQGPHRRREY